MQLGALFRRKAIVNNDHLDLGAVRQVSRFVESQASIPNESFQRLHEATHGTAPKYADKDVINPGSVILSGVMMFDFMGWEEAARLIENAMEYTIGKKTVTYDFERLMEGAQKVSTSQFAKLIVKNMDHVAAHVGNHNHHHAAHE